MKRLVVMAVVLLSSRMAAADPPLPHVLTAPTAWLPPEGAVVATAGLDNRLDGSVNVGFGLGSLAALDVGADTDSRQCTTMPCSGDATTVAEPRWLPRAGFRMGLRQDFGFKGMPAVLIGARKTFGHPRQVGEVYVVASRVVGYLRVHVGLSAMDARSNPTGSMGLRMRTHVRPLAGLELTTPLYPKTTLMGDIAWVPRFAEAMTTAAPTPEWVIGWGGRYQALTWGSIELDVRHRGKGKTAEELASSTVMVRINGVWERGAKKR